MKTLTRWGVLAVVSAGSVMATLSSQALTLTLAQALGYSEPGTATNIAEDEALVNSIVDRANGASSSSYDAVGHLYTVVSAPSTPYPYGTGVLWGAVGGDDEVALGTGGYKYLLVKYDGEQGSGVIWDVAGLTGNIGVPEKDMNNKTHNNYTLFNAVPVPDGGQALAMMGIGLLALGFLRTRLA